MTAEEPMDSEVVQAASSAIDDWCRANPADFEPVAPAPGFDPPPERVTVSYHVAEPTWVECPACEGDEGWMDGGVWRECLECEGTGGWSKWPA